MGKQLLKAMMVFGVLFMLGRLPADSPLVLFFLLIVSILSAALLAIIVLALVKEMKILQGPGRGRKTTAGQEKGRSCLTIRYKDIDVSYLPELNGGGIIFAYEFVHVVAQRIGKVRHVCEYCAGPGFIGFSLLANNLCDRLTLTEVNPKAIAAIKETIKNNRLEDRVAVYQSDCLESISEKEKWDLVVGNPPWHLHKKGPKDIRVCDPGGRVHKKFFQDVHKFLKPGGTILFIEGGEYTNAKAFQPMIDEYGLSLIEAFSAVPFLKIFQNIKEYQPLKWTLVVFLRLCLSVREAYFIRVGKQIPACPCLCRSNRFPT